MRAVACLCFREGWERGERRPHADDAQQRRFVAARLLWLGRRTPSLAGTRRIERLRLSQFVNSFGGTSSVPAGARPE